MSRFPRDLSSAAILPLLLGLTSCGGGGGGAPPAGGHTEKSAGCLQCHSGIEEIHVRHALGCTDCHGGDASTTDKDLAHVRPSEEVLGGERVAPLDHDPRFLRFLNPSDFRIIEKTCGRTGAGSGTDCHSPEGVSVTRSLMATNAGLFQALAWSNGLRADRSAASGVFPAADSDGVVPAGRGAVASLDQVPPENTSLPPSDAARHASALPHDSCVRCHLWSNGRGVRGEPGHEGLYRSQGCAACHLSYDDDGLYKGSDPTIDPGEPGHGRTHFVSLKIPTEQCAHCHVGGYRIGLSYRGLGEVPPGLPAGPGVRGTTSSKLYGDYLLDDGVLVQQDVHAEAGLVCIDCHTTLEAHGDAGNVDTEMSFATEIRCEDCHGSLSHDTTFTTSRGNPLPQLRLENGDVLLRGKLDGADHLVKQVRAVVDPNSDVYSPAAANAMTPDHLRDPGAGGLECYACHATWHPTDLARVIDRDFGKTGTDLLTGDSPAGAFDAPERSYPSHAFLYRYLPVSLGRNSRGRVVPFMPTEGGFLASARDAAGGTLAHEATPVAADGLSGLVQDAAFPHTVSIGTRDCVECHRNPSSLGLGGDGLPIARRLAAAAAGADGVSLVDRSDPDGPFTVARIPTTDSRAALWLDDPVTVEPRYLAIADGASGVRIADVADPESPVLVAGVATTDARALALVGHHLLVADGPGGVAIVDVADPAGARLVASVPAADARDVAVSGTFAFVADGADGVVVLDVADPAAAFVALTLDLNGDDPSPNDARAVAVAPLYSPMFFGFKAFELALAVADGLTGVHLIDVSDVTFTFEITVLPSPDPTDVAFASDYVRAAGSRPSREINLLAVTDRVDGLGLFEVPPFDEVKPLGAIVDAGLSPEGLSFGFALESAGDPLPKLLAHLAATSGRFTVVDCTDPLAPFVRGELAVAPSLPGVAVEAFEPTRRVGEDGTPLRATGFSGSRVLDASEILRILRTEIQ